MCRAVRYCSWDCQKKDRKFHKRGCTLIQSGPKGLGGDMIRPGGVSNDGYEDDDRLTEEVVRSVANERL